MQVWRGRMCQQRCACTIGLCGTGPSWWSAGWRKVALCTVVVLLAACDLPTKPPKLQSRLLLRTESMTVPVSDLLPSSVQVIDSSFHVSLAPATLVGHSLGAVCGSSCVAPPGVQVPKPAFTDSSDVQSSTTSDVVGATLTGGAIEIALTHGLSFDPLHPAGASEAGWIRLSARSGGRVIGTLLIQEPFPSGVTLHRTMPVLPGDVTGDVTVSAVLHSPAGSPVPSEWLRSDATLLAGTVTSLELAAAEARVRVSEQRLSVEGVAVDVTGIDASVIRRVRGGVARITIDNPFAVSGTLELRLERSGAAVQKTLQLMPDQRTIRLELSEAELHTLLGHLLTLSFDGVVAGTSGAVAVRPGQEIGITTSFELVLEIG
jgi:hypothetical protein